MFEIPVLMRSGISKGKLSHTEARELVAFLLVINRDIIISRDVGSFPLPSSLQHHAVACQTLLGEFCPRYFTVTSRKNPRGKARSACAVCL